jgi:hypothetical protein
LMAIAPAELQTVIALNLSGQLSWYTGPYSLFHIVAEAILDIYDSKAKARAVGRGRHGNFQIQCDHLNWYALYL